ncbi:MAG: hypothetical protein COA44_12615 [Arcobacter sp.]|nr:MAG: hypothetical protein COA44_12615 [Arcobacter sp.]
MKKAFTLVELMISIILLSIIVTFLYQSVAQLQTSNLQFMRKTDGLQKREQVLKLLYNDFINARTVQWYDKGRDHDIILIQTNNSFHNMSQPYVLYKVYKEDSVLKRIESPAEKIDFLNNIFKFNDIIENVKLFKVYEQKGHYLIYIKAKDLEDIYLDILPPSFLSTAKITGTNDNNSTKSGG